MRDFVVLIDRSGSTRDASGTDVDGDGEVGRKTFSRLTSDADDGVLAAEVHAAREFLARLDPALDRASVVAFAVDTQTLAPLGSPLAATTARAAWTPRHPERNDCWVQRRDGKRRRANPGWGVGYDPSDGVLLCATGTSIGQALGRGARLLIERTGPDATRLASFVVFSDGEAETPDAATALRHAREAARYLAAHGVSVHGVDFVSPHARPRRDVMREVAEITNGAFIDTREPGASERLAALAGSGIRKIAVRNLTTGADGGTPTPGPSGEFSGEVVLAPGDNRISLTFEVAGALGFSREMSVRYEPAAP